MKLGGLITGGLALLIALSLAAEENGNTSIRETPEAQKLTRMNEQHQSAELKRLTDLAEPETQIEDQEIEPSRRVRTRNGAVKRRRRLRKRPRTTTAEPFSDDPYEGANFEPQFSRSRRPHHEYYGEEHQTIQRRRQGKRRRRPLRRYPDHQRTEYLDERPRLEEVAEIPPRRRRKGGKKRLRISDVRPPPVVQTDDEAVIPEHDFNREPVHPETSTQETVRSTNPPEFKLASEESTIIFDQNQPTEDTRSTGEYRTDADVVTTTETYGKSESEDVNHSNNEFHHTDTNMESADHPEDEHDLDNSNLLNSIGTEANLVNYTEEGTTTTSMRTETTKEEVIFDRKALFPTSKRLPLTSALIRRRLRPNSKTNKESNDVKDLTRNEIVPGSLMAQGNYTKIPTEQLLEQWRTHMSNNEEATEERNYPKILPNIKKVPKTKDNILNTDKRLKTNEPNEHNESIDPDSNERDVASSENGRLEENKNQKVEKTDETLKYEALDIPNVKDDILELLKSDSGASRLARILELRNMTLAELIEHRERGSSQLHLSEIFKRSHHTAPNRVEPTEENPEDNPEYVKQENNSDQKPIEFPNEEIMGSFPKYLQEQIGSGSDVTMKTTTGRGSKQNDSRESRAFKSTTDKVKSSVTSQDGEPVLKRIPPYPSWKVIPNPKLKPVSVQGEYEEIYLTKYKGTSRKNSSEETNEVITFGENESPLFHKNNIRGQLSAESIKTKIPNQTTFRRIPPGMKSAIIVSGAILVLAIFGFLSVLISCRVRQRRARIRAKQDILCEQLQNEDFMNSQRSLSPVLTKAHREPVFSQGIHSNTTSNRHYYLWRTLRKTFQYD